MHWRDLVRRRQPGVWAGLHLTVQAPVRPALLVSVCPPDRIRVGTEERPMLWARVEPDYFGVDLLRSASRASPATIPPITAAEVRALHSDDPVRTAAAWARHFAQALTRSDRSPLAQGEWLLQPTLHGLERARMPLTLASDALARPAVDILDWSSVTHGECLPPVLLRAPSLATAGRVKAWARQARAGSLPPVLLMWVSGLQAHVVLDGHDRLQAAVQEGADVPALVLLRHGERCVDEQGLARADIIVERSGGADMTVEARNRLLLDLYSPARDVLPSRADLMRGGVDQWVAEVDAEARQGEDVQINDPLTRELLAQLKG
ncbi:hypothetical protein [Stenotrophomonas sp. MYb57]|uniref:hypothetical protein n=1 Tax=Stenotrophomonas sp. MYb57 TaxID=1827305 RepID=UPI00131A1180|nr:hypothetical protein [Stenotrophomonas sp. MYb57]